MKTSYSYLLPLLFLVAASSLFAIPMVEEDPVFNEPEKAPALSRSSADTGLPLNTACEDRSTTFTVTEKDDDATENALSEQELLAKAEEQNRISISYYQKAAQLPVTSEYSDEKNFNIDSGSYLKNSALQKESAANYLTQARDPSIAEHPKIVLFLKLASVQAQKSAVCYESAVEEARIAHIHCLQSKKKEWSFFYEKENKKSLNHVIKTAKDADTSSLHYAEAAAYLQQAIKPDMAEHPELAAWLEAASAQTVIAATAFIEAAKYDSYDSHRGYLSHDRFITVVEDALSSAGQYANAVAYSQQAMEPDIAERLELGNIFKNGISRCNRCSCTLCSSKRNISTGRVPSGEAVL